MLVWAKFLVTAGLIVLAAIQLAKYGDALAVRTRLGGMFVGILLMAGATSLPEVLTSISSIKQNSPNLAAGNLMGSNTFNMFLLAIIDVIGRNQRLLRKAALKHALSGSLAVFMIGLVVFFLVAKIKGRIGWVGIDSICIMLAYIVAVWLIQGNTERITHKDPLNEIVPQETPSLGRSLIGFGLAVVALVIVTPIMVESSNEIAVVTGLGASFIGTTLVALVTSLPELVTTFAAIKIGADDMAIGNLFGSNMFNMFAVGLSGLFFTQGNFLETIDSSFVLVGMMGLVMTTMALIGNLARLEKRIGFIELDALALVVVYIAGLYLLYIRG